MIFPNEENDIGISDISDIRVDSSIPDQTPELIPEPTPRPIQGLALSEARFQEYGDTERSFESMADSPNNIFNLNEWLV